MLRGVLRGTFRVRVYREHCEWVHPLCEEHVQPTMLKHYQQIRRTLNKPDRWVCHPASTELHSWRHCTVLHGLPRITSNSAV